MTVRPYMKIFFCYYADLSIWSPLDKSVIEKITKLNIRKMYIYMLVHRYDNLPTSRQIIFGAYVLFIFMEYLLSKFKVHQEKVNNF